MVTAPVLPISVASYKRIAVPPPPPPPDLPELPEIEVAPPLPPPPPVQNTKNEILPAVGVNVPEDVKTWIVAPKAIAAQLAIVPLVLRYFPLCPDCEGKALPGASSSVLSLIVATVIHALLAALRFFQTGSVPLVSIQS
jgi:hypothetical protein